MSVHHLCKRNCGGTDCDAPKRTAVATEGRQVRDAFDPRLVPKEAPVVIPLDTSIRARLMRAVDRVLYRLVNLRSPL